MSRDDQRKDLGGITNFIRNVREQVKVRTSRKCHKCGARIAWHDVGDCDNHKLVHLDPQEHVDHDISITLMPSPGPRPDQPKRIQRDATDQRTPVERKYHTNKARPQDEEREDFEPFWADDPDFRPNAPVYTRSNKSSLGWNASATELAEAQDRAERGIRNDDDEPYRS